MEKIFRVFLLPFGLFFKLYELSIIGARDIHNKARFREAIIDGGCCINPQSMIGVNCHVLENSLILNSSIRSFSYIGKNSIIQNVKVGSYCSIANDVFIGLGAHPVEYFSTSPLFYRVRNTFDYSLIKEDYEFKEYQQIVIGNDVWVGARAMIMDGVCIGDGAIVAANAVVTKDVPPYAIVGGVPAKVIRYRFTPEKIEKLLAKQWWSWSVDDIQKRMSELKDL